MFVKLKMILMIVLVVLTVSSCSGVRTDLSPDPNKGKDNSIIADIEPVATNSRAVELKKSPLKKNMKDGDLTGNMTASKYANFEDTIDRLLDIVTD